MSEPETKESLTIARFSLYAALISAVLAALTLFVDTDLFNWLRGWTKPTEVPAAGADSGTTTQPPGIDVPPAPPALTHPLGEYALLTDGSVRDRVFEVALNGLPYVTAAPTEGVWLGKICMGDVIVTVDDDAPPDDLAAVGAAISQASAIVVRPSDLWDSAPSANVEVSSASARRC